MPLHDAFEELIPIKEQMLEKPCALILCGNSNSEEISIRYLRQIGYTVEWHTCVAKIDQYLFTHIPQVLLLDLDCLGEKAIRLTRALKENPMTYTTPIIIGYGKRNLVQEINILEAGAEDFLTKPLSPQVLAARIHTSYRRNLRLQVSNPLTGLPGAIYVEEQATQRLANDEKTALCYADLDFFKAFNDKYSYNRGDKVIRLLATLLIDAVAAHGAPTDCVGHIGGDDFVMILDPDHVQPVCQYVVNNFDTLVPFQYEDSDREQGFIRSVNRSGKPTKFPLMTVSIGVVTNVHKPIASYLEMTELAAEMKEYAKSTSKSSARQSTFRIDLRKN